VRGSARIGRASAQGSAPDSGPERWAAASLETRALLDEWQAVPAVLTAIKRAVDADRTPGRYLLTGSVRADLRAERRRRV